MTLGTISKRIKTTESELAGLKERIDVLKVFFLAREAVPGALISHVVVFTAPRAALDTMHCGSRDNCTVRVYQVVRFWPLKSSNAMRPLGECARREVSWREYMWRATTVGW